MPSPYITRSLEPVLQKAASEFPAVVLTGPRQSGKTTLLKHLFRKRLVKTPKVYFTDTGTLCYLAGLMDPDHAARGPMGGAILETAVLSELFKTLTHRGMDPRIWFWRTTAGKEIDFLVETGGKLVPIEVKLSATPHPAMAASIRELRQDMADAILPGYVVHPGDVRLALGDGVTAVGLREV